MLEVVIALTVVGAMLVNTCTVLRVVDALKARWVMHTRNEQVVQMRRREVDLLLGQADDLASVIKIGDAYPEGIVGRVVEPLKEQLAALRERIELLQHRGIGA